MSLVKYRLKEVATDFGVTPKDIAEVMGKFFEKHKSNTQVLTEDELNVIFDYFTFTHQISSLEAVFAVQPAPKAEKPAAPKAEEKPAAKAEEKPAAEKPAAPKAEPKPEKPGKEPREAPAEAEAEAERKPRRRPNHRRRKPSKPSGEQQ